MLIDRVTNPWIKFKVTFTTLQEEDEKQKLAKKAFLHVIANYSSYNFPKEKMLNEIIEAYPDVILVIYDSDLHECFDRLCRQAKERNQIVSPAELNWVNKYVRNAEIRNQIEKLIYRIVLGASSYWDKMRQAFNWTISDSDKLELVREVLQDENLGSQRKREVAQEFGEPEDKFISAYYKKLLYDRHYDQAEALGVSDSELVIDVIIKDINNGYVADALDVADRFLPDRKDIIEELHAIERCLS